MSVCKICGSTPSYCGHFERPRARRDTRAAPATSTRASDAECDMIYRAMLAALPLEPEHRKALRKRGLDDREIGRRLYRTLPLRGRSRIAKALVEQFGVQTCGQIPGLFVGEGRDGSRFWSIAGSAGLLIPVRDVRGHIVALKIRRDNDEAGAKYTSMSSASRGGPSPGAPVHVAVCDLADRREARVTEGEIKADIAAALTQIPTISIPGVAMWRRVLPVLEAIKPQKVLLAFDMDFLSNVHVAKALWACAKAIKALDMNVVVEMWDVRYKGVDDLLAAGGTPRQEGMEVLRGFWTTRQGPLHAAGLRTLNAEDIPQWL